MPKTSEIGRPEDKGGKEGPKEENVVGGRLGKVLCSSASWETGENTGCLSGSK